MNKPAARRRFRAVARPQERARRLRVFGAAAAVLMLGVIASVAARHALKAYNQVRRSIPVEVSTPGLVTVSVLPESFRILTQSVADETTGSAAEKASAIKEKYPCISDISVHRSWGDPRATLTPVLRHAAVLALRHGKSVGYMDDEGVVFPAPLGLYSVSGPSVDVGEADEAQRKELLRQWPALTAPTAFPSPLAMMAYVSSDVGWQAHLQDGTVVLWGHLNFTQEKIKRLGEALADARIRAPGTMAADLRWFEDGKVLLKPVGREMSAGMRGGFR